MVLDNSEIRIGDQTTLHILFEYDNPNEDALIGWPYFDNDLTKKVEIIDKTIDYEELIDSANFTYLREQKLVITSFEPGNYIIPGQTIELNDSSYTTNDLEIFVSTVKVDTSKGLVANHENYQVDYSFGERTADWLKKYWYLLVILAILIAIYFIYRFIKKRKSTEEEEIYVPKIPAHITALASLKTLLNKKSWETENKKEYYSNLTDTVRLYLEERYGIYAMEQTTREIITHLKNSPINDDDKAYLRKILSEADMVKFAKFKPQNEDGKKSLDQSIDFVERTKMEEEEEVDE